jgi:hypothetical protein
MMAADTRAIAGVRRSRIAPNAGTVAHLGRLEAGDKQE